ncbi:MAG: hypothetical protein WAU02_01065 [Candidatus Saccharimonadales bacterium]
MILVVVGIVFAALFVVAFMTKRRYGVLAMALAAGSVLSTTAGRIVADSFSANAITFEPYDTDVVVMVLLTLAPVMTMFISGPTYHSKRAALVGAMAIGVVSVCLLLGPLVATWPADSAVSRDVVNMLGKWRNPLIMVGLVAAIIDTFTIHNVTPRKHAKSEKH